VIERDAEIGPGLEKGRPQPDRLAIGGDRFVEFPGARQRDTEIVARLGTGGCPLDQIGERHRGRARQAEVQVSLADPGIGLRHVGVLAQNTGPGPDRVLEAALGEQDLGVIGHGLECRRSGRKWPSFTLGRSPLIGRSSSINVRQVPWT
jgi:hypothetical protein